MLRLLDAPATRRGMGTVFNFRFLVWPDPTQDRSVPEFSRSRSPVSRKIAAASWNAVIASSNRPDSCRARPRLSSATASPCRSPISRKRAAASWRAVMASSNRPQLLQGAAEDVQRHGFAVPVAGLPEDGGRVLVGGDGLLEPAHLLQRAAEVVQRARPSPCRSPVSRKMAAASWWAVMASSNRPHLPQCEAEVVQRHAFAVLVAGLPEDRGRVLVRR